MSEPMLPYGRQWIDDQDVRAVEKVLRSNYLTTGPAVGEFEQALANVTGASHAVALSSGTSALHAMYFAAGLRGGDEMITSPLTFAATANAALYLGAKVRFGDIDPDTGNLDSASVEPMISNRTRLIVAVDYAGHPADYDSLSSIAAEHNVLLLADAAHSLGATYKGRPVGTLAHASALSFHPVKPITSGEGGAVVTNDAHLAQRSAQFRSHGITRHPDEMSNSDGPWFYEMQDLGFNYRLTDIQAALGRSQLRRLEEFTQRRRRIAAHYGAALSDVPGLVLPTVLERVEPSWHLYVVRVADPFRRRTFFERLLADGLGVQVHYVPVHYHPYYRKLGYEPGIAPAAEHFYHGAVSLPIYPLMLDADVVRVIDVVRRAAAAVL